MFFRNDRTATESARNAGIRSGRKVWRNQSEGRREGGLSMTRIEFAVDIAELDCRDGVADILERMKPFIEGSLSIKRRLKITIEDIPEPIKGAND